MGRQDHVAEIAQTTDERESDEHRCDHPHANHSPSLQAHRWTIGDGWVSGRWPGGAEQKRREPIDARVLKTDSAQQGHRPAVL